MRAAISQIFRSAPGPNLFRRDIGEQRLIDGARAGNPLDHSSYTRVNLSAIEEVEVITGAFSAEYGEAMSGVINVIMKEGGESYEMYLDARYQPPGLRHWGTSFYDRSSPLYWENSNALHQEWWVENTDMWVDPNGTYGSDPASTWTPGIGGRSASTRC